MSFPHQLALEVQIGRFSFESMLIAYIDGRTIAKACDFLSKMCYAVFMDNLVSFPHQLVLVVQIGTFTFQSMLIKYPMSDGGDSDVIRCFYNGKSL